MRNAHKVGNSSIYRSQKSPKSTEIANHRSISILPTIAKIIERVVYEQLFYYFASHHLFSSSQHGFRYNHSTDTALLSVTDHVFSAMDRSQITLLCLLDCSKCFDVFRTTHCFENFNSMVSTPAGLAAILAVTTSGCSFRRPLLVDL